MLSIMMEQKKPEKNDITLSGEKLRKYFPRSYTPFQIENTIFKLLDAWQKSASATRAVERTSSLFVRYFMPKEDAMYINTFKYTPKDVSCQLCTEYVKSWAVPPCAARGWPSALRPVWSATARQS